MACGKWHGGAAGPILAYVDREGITAAGTSDIKECGQWLHIAKWLVSAQGWVRAPPLPIRNLGALHGDYLV